jgi:Tfp pilus assembly protein PilX
MKMRRKNLTNRSERGVALFTAVLVLLLITGITAGMLIMSNTETNISANFRDEQNAFFNAKAGIEEVRDRLRGSATNSLLASLPTNLPGQANSVLYVTNPTGSETVAPWSTTGSNYPDDEICKEVTCATGGVPAGTPWYISAAASSSYAATPALSWKWTRITAKTDRMSSGTLSVSSVDGSQTSNNRVCWNGSNETVVTAASCPAVASNYKQVYVLTSLAVAPGGSRRMVQAEATSTAMPTVPGAMVFDGPSPDYSTNPNSAAFSVSGQDAAQGPNAGAGCGPAVNEPAIGGYDTASTTTINGQLNRPSSYTSSSPYPASDAVSTVNSQLGPLGTVDGLTTLVNSMAAVAGANVYGSATSWPNLPSSGSGPTNWGTDTAPVINFIEGDYSGGISGAGILVVTGTLTMSGTPSYNGLILVIGKGKVVKNGGGNGTLNGSLLVANLYTDTSYSTFIPLGTNHAPGPPIIQWNGGGNATIQYDSCWANAMNTSMPYRIVAVREMMY